VLDDKRTLDEAMKQEPRFVALQGRDRAFAANLALATLRALGNVDEALARHLARPLPDSARFARATLRTGAAQMLEGIAPVHAAVGRAVDIARHEPTGRGFTGLINAVLRKVALIDPATLPARGRVPQVWWSRWRTGHGEAAADRIADSLTGQPALDLTVLTDVADWLARAAEAGIAARRLDGGPAGPASVRLEQSVGDVTGLPGWADGEILVQDAAAALPARLLGVRRGQTVLDLCAAPGGKTVQLAAMGAAVVAMDIDAARLDRVRQNLERTHLDARLEVGDATRTVGEAACDAILLDAPCTATGTLRRNPETLWIKSPADVARLSAQQGALVEAAARALAPGGRLVYAVCSLEAEEADPACARALACGLEPDPIRAEEVGMFADALTPDGRLRILPSLEARGGVGSDGFFIARFRRPAAVAC
jgi:16S rRNA (cytosine967-C5)-methyltransferase